MPNELPACARCGHRSWAHGSQNGFPAPGATCYAATDTGDECDCIGFATRMDATELHDDYRPPSDVARAIVETLRDDHKLCRQYEYGGCFLAKLTADDVQEILNLAAGQSAETNDDGRGKRCDVYVRLDDGKVAKTIEYTTYDGLNVDVDADGHPVGVEVINALGVEVNGKLVESAETNDDQRSSRPTRLPGMIVEPADDETIQRRLSDASTKLGVAHLNPAQSTALLARLGKLEAVALRAQTLADDGDETATYILNG